MVITSTNGRFSPVSISMSILREGFNSAGYTIPPAFTLSSLVGKILYNENGTTYTVPAITPTFSLSLKYFFGRYYLNPAPLVNSHFGGEAVAIPGLPSRPTPTRFSVRLVGASGGGGGGGGSYDCTPFFDNQDGGGGGGGGGGETLVADFVYVAGRSITNTGGNTGLGGSGAGSVGCTQVAGPGGNGTDGQLLTFTYGTEVRTARGGKGGKGGTGAGYNSDIAVSASYRGVGGLGGENGDPATGKGGDGGTTGGGAGGNGNGGFLLGGKGGEGGMKVANAPTQADELGQPGKNGGQGFIIITWYFT